jgi:hypothetical protein
MLFLSFFISVFIAASDGDRHPFFHLLQLSPILALLLLSFSLSTLATSSDDNQHPLSLSTQPKL